jgi:hypothetical protein
MGFFSWFTSDTEKSIANNYSTRSTFPVHMVTEDGMVFTENNYEGYGVFGGKDLYVLIAELNGYKGETDEETRDLAFKHIWKRGIKKGDKVLYHSWVGEEGTFMKYDTPIESEGGICANDLVSQHGWTSFGDSGEFEDWAEQGIKVPKLVEQLPSNSTDWKEWWASLPYPVSCGDQGFFYAEDEDDECFECGRIMNGGECEYCDSEDVVDEDE